MAPTHHTHHITATSRFPTTAGRECDTGDAVGPRVGAEHTISLGVRPLRARPPLPPLCPGTEVFLDRETLATIVLSEAQAKMLF